MADTALARSPDPDLLDQRVFLSGVTWEGYERLLELCGDDNPGIRMTYLDGQLEIMTPSKYHERLKTRLSRLLEVWSEETGIDLEGAGSTTFRNRLKKAGLEPDECYYVGRIGGEEESPDIALEVIWTSGGIDKLAVYAALGVREVWFWRDGQLDVHALRANRYEAIDRSQLLPAFDPDVTTRLMTAPISQAEAIRKLRSALRAR
jgi:Uma2 family endonuclease